MKYYLHLEVAHNENICEGWFILGELSDYESFQEELIQNEEILQNLSISIIEKDRLSKRNSSIVLSALEGAGRVFSIFSILQNPPQIKNLEIVQYNILNTSRMVNKIINDPKLNDFIEAFNQKNSQMVQTPAPADSLLVHTDPAPADPLKKPKRKKRKNLTPNEIKEIADYAARNPGATNKDLAERFNLSDEVFRKEKPLRRAVDMQRTGDLNRHAVKPYKSFNDEN